MKQSIILTASLFLLLAGALLAAESHQAKLKIEGMTCSVCVGKVKKQLKNLCQEIRVDLAKGEGLCTYQSPVTVEQIVSEANKTGFKTSVQK